MTRKELPDLSANSITEFVYALAATSATVNSFNMYSGDSQAAEICRGNLTLYLQGMQQRNIHTMLLGEAPGYQGCRLTGISFTSEFILMNGIPSLDLFGAEQGYRRSTTADRLHKEPSATIVWQTLENLESTPVLWPAFPFHPHKPGNSRSNRTPTRKELAIGESFWKKLIEIMNIQQVAAIGRIAHESLLRIGIEGPRIRHPSQGGKPEFVAGMRRLAADGVLSPTSKFPKVHFRE